MRIQRRLKTVWLPLLLLVILSVVPTLAAESPTLEVSVDKSVIQSGGKATITWSSSGTKYCQMSHGIGLLKREGSVEVSPTATTTYTITAFGTKWRSSLDEATRKGQETAVSVTIKVEGAPPLVSFAPSSFSIYQGDSVDLSWVVDNASACSIAPGIGSVPSKGKMTVRPEQTTEYVLTATGAGGEASSRITVTVNPRVSR